MYYYDYNAERQIEKEIFKIEQITDYSKELNWDNIKKDFEILVHKYDYLNKKEKNIPEDSPIWVMWYQGIKFAPPLVQACVSSIIKNRAKHPVYILDKYNLEKYIKLP